MTRSSLDTVARPLVSRAPVGTMTDEVKLDGYTLGRALGEGAFAVCRIGHKNAQPDVQVLAVLYKCGVV